MNAETTVEWAPALAILAAGLVLGVALVWRLFASSRRAAKASAPSGSRPVLRQAGAGAPAVDVRDIAGWSEATLSPPSRSKARQGARSPRLR